MKQTKNLFFFLLVASAAFGSTYASPDDESNSLHCTKIFPCYKDLQPRIAFWKSIFSTHGDNAVVFHDIDEPGRVYSVLETNAACTSRNESLPIKRERNRIREILLSLSKKDIYEDSLTEEEQTIAKVFRSPKKSDFFEASKNIRCQDGNQHQFKKAVERYQYYQPEVVKILGEYNLPQEIQYLPFVESSYNPLAFSKVGAAGLWQIMPSTARNLGLKLNAYVDERLDPIKSTQAAAKYFRQSFDILQDEIQRQNYVTQASQLGPLVITSYNYGVGGMKSAIRQYGPDYMNILERYKSRSFQTAVKNFYASFLAAMEVAQHSKQYFGNLPPFMPIEGQSFELPRSISIVKFSQHFNYSLDELKQLNPSFSRRVWKGTFALPKDYTLFVPKGVHSLNELKETVLALNRDDIEVKVDQYRVERGDTACKIASSFRVSCRELIVANDLNSKGLIRVGQILMIPDSSTETAPRVVASIKAAPEPAKDNRPTIMDAEKIKPSPAPKEEVEESQTHELPAQPASPEKHPIQLAQAFGANESLFIQEEAKDRKKQYFIYVETEETLGHYADWLSIGWATKIRKANRMSIDDDIVVGQKLILPIDNTEEKKKFEDERIRYHLTIEEGFREKYAITGNSTYRVQRGDNYWSISKKLQVPLWLLSRYNPDLYKEPIKLGDVLNVPDIEPIEQP